MGFQIDIPLFSAMSGQNEGSNANNMDLLK